MKRKYKDIVGGQFGQLTAIAYAGSTKEGRAKWLCECDCGNRTTVLLTSLTGGHATSCGCLLKSKITTHGKSNTKFYRVWLSMKTRCNNPRSNRYKYYGGKGITYDSRWETFENFYIDMYEGYKEGLTLDRINRERSYSKDNCRWVGITTQNNNKSDNLLILYRGKSHSPKEIVELTSLSLGNIYNRKRAGWSDEKITSTPIASKFANKRDE